MVPMARTFPRLVCLSMCRCGTFPVLCFLASQPAAAQSMIAYYRFESGVPGSVVSMPVPDTTGTHVFEPELGTDATYRDVVPTPLVAQNHLPNALSIEFTSTASLACNDIALNTFTWPSWTIEAYVRFKSITGFQTFVGKDGPSGSGADVYLQRSQRTGTFFFSFIDTEGVQRGGEGGVQIQPSQWYHVAAVWDGALLSLYVDGQLQWSNPAPRGMIDRPTRWTIGRGWYIGPTDTSNAYVDEVRFSSAALLPTQFLNAGCYANCDSSTGQPVLNVNDFVCFQSAFAAGDPYANCDGSSVPPVLNVNDFICFQAAFAAGCP